VTATLGSSSTTATITVEPSQGPISSFTLSPASVQGGTSFAGTVTLSAPAPSGGATVTSSSGDTAVATVPASVTVPAGATSATFIVTTQSVPSNTTVVIIGTYEGIASGDLFVTT
jgi:hypothetical protein